MPKPGKLPLTAAIAGALLAVGIATGTLLPTFFPLASERDGSIDCDFEKSPCTRVLAEAGMTATLAITPQPVETMKDLSLRIVLSAAAAPITDAEVTLGFSMPGMTMAPNVVPLVHQGGGVYRGKGVLVKCRGGKRWQADLRVRRASVLEKPPARASFTFKVQ
ncbi:MAG: FixH family protein [Deltaproteobacteria bacterium]|nr:FixH family protein [Deltaproteobacteria bacterium]